MRRKLKRINLNKAHSKRTKILNRKSDLTTPFIVTISLVLLWFFFRITALFWATATRCVSFHEFWFEPANYQWPPFASFLIAFFLLFVWNICLYFHPNNSKLNYVILSINTIAMSGVFYILFLLFGNSLRTHNSDMHASLNWNMTEPNFEYSDLCQARKPFLGRWIVQSISPLHNTEPFPYIEVFFNPDFTLKASGRLSGSAVIGKWRLKSPYSGTGLMIIGQNYVGDFTLNGDTMTLSRKESVRWNQSVISFSRSNKETKNTRIVPTL